MILSTNEHIAYIILILILLIAFVIKYLCVYVFKCDEEYNKRNIYNV